MKISRIKINFKVIIERLIVFLVIILSNTVWCLGDTQMLDYKSVRFFLWGIALLWIVLYSKITYPDLNFVYFMIISGSLYIIFNINYISPFMSQVFIPFLLFYFIGVSERNRDTIEDIAHIFVNIVYVMAIISLYFYLFASILNIIQPTGYYVSDWSWKATVPSYYNLYYEPMTTIKFGLSLVRNCGIYPEAPMYNFPLCLALIIQEFFLPKSIKKTVVLTITILSTLTSTGIVVLAGVYIYKLVTSKNKDRLIRIFVPIIAISVGTIIVTLELLQKSGTGSFKIRFDHMLACFKCFVDTLGMGCGVSNYTYVQKYMKYVQGISVGFPLLIAQGGIFVVLIYMYQLFIFLRNGLKSKEWNKLLFWVLYFWLIFTTAIIYDNIAVFSCIIFFIPMKSQH